MELQFQGKYMLKGNILCETGLHIGGTQEGVEIGGVDNIVTRNPLTDEPYIPGSSLKGKLRHLLEWATDKVFAQQGKVGEFPAHSCQNDPKAVEVKKDTTEYEKKVEELLSQCPICLIFGASAATRGISPTRLTVRDSFPLPETVNEWEKWLGQEIYTELKTENTIDRVTSTANPRTMERVPAGSVFAYEMIFDIYHNNDHQLLKNLFTAMYLLENSALGGSGSRGSGKIKFTDLKLALRSKDYYLGDEKQETVVVMASLTEDKNQFEITGELDSHSINYESSVVRHIQVNWVNLTGLEAS